MADVPSRSLFSIIGVMFVGAVAFCAAPPQGQKSDGSLKFGLGLNSDPGTPTPPPMGMPLDSIPPPPGVTPAPLPLPTIDPRTPVKELLPVAPKAKRSPIYLGSD